MTLTRPCGLAAYNARVAREPDSSPGPPSVRAGISDDVAARLLAGARTLSRTPREMATSLEIVGFAGPVSLIETAATRIAETFGLSAAVDEGDPVCVRFERR